MKGFFWMVLSCIKGVGSKTLIHLYENYPDLNFDNVSVQAEAMSKKSMQKLLAPENIEVAKKTAEKQIALHEAKDIRVIPISSDLYPDYLRLIADPPKVLYAKGNLELLKEKKNLAVVGTREPTEIGIRSARKISAIFAKMGYTIVSGLALGIDTAGHEGALQVENGKTIAVMAGNLTEIYPAKNKALAQKVLERDGLWLSETPIGQANTRGNFVKRDRIQSGLALGVCPVQTPIASGTQHTIEFSRKQNRFLFTPIPLEQDEDSNAIQGNLELINNGTAVLENKNSYQTIHQSMLEVQLKLDLEHKARFEVKQDTQSKPERREPETITEQLNLFD